MKNPFIQVYDSCEGIEIESVGSEITTTTNNVVSLVNGRRDDGDILPSEMMLQGKNTGDGDAKSTLAQKDKSPKSLSEIHLKKNKMSKAHFQNSNFHPRKPIYENISFGGSKANLSSELGNPKSLPMDLKEKNGELRKSSQNKNHSVPLEVEKIG